MSPLSIALYGYSAYSILKGSEQTENTSHFSSKQMQDILSSQQTLLEGEKLLYDTDFSAALGVEVELYYDMQNSGDAACKAIVTITNKTTGVIRLVGTLLDWGLTKYSELKYPYYLFNTEDLYLNEGESKTVELYGIYTPYLFCPVHKVTKKTTTEERKEIYEEAQRYAGVWSELKKLQRVDERNTLDVSYTLHTFILNEDQTLTYRTIDGETELINDLHKADVLQTDKDQPNYIKVYRLSEENVKEENKTGEDYEDIMKTFNNWMARGESGLPFSV